MTFWEITGIAVCIAAIIALHATESSRRDSWRDAQMLRPNRRRIK